MTAAAVREARIVYSRRRIRSEIVSSSAVLAALVRAVVPAGEGREVFVVIGLSHALQPTMISLVSVGSMTSTLVHPREVLVPVLVSGSTSFAISHNHPSGSVTPSPEDDAVTRRLARCGHILGVPLLDHVIIGDSVYSYSEQGRARPGNQRTRPCPACGRKRVLTPAEEPTP